MRRTSVSTAASDGSALDAVDGRNPAGSGSPVKHSLIDEEHSQ